MIKTCLVAATLVAIALASVNLEADTQNYIAIEKIFAVSLIPEGAGADVRRAIGSAEIRRLDPFLMLDLFSVKLPGGFPDHPHRGFETVTYMLSGTFYHEDFIGNQGTINAGDLQWMTAGKGIVHAEVPASHDKASVGFQLWLNLAAKDKFCEPEYQEIKKDKVPIVKKDNMSVKVIAGESHGEKGPIHTRSPVIFLDLELAPNSTFEQVIPKGWNSFSYVYEGEGYFGQDSKKAGTHSCVLLENGDKEILLIRTQEKPLKAIIVGGLPMNEPVVSYGPFVLSNSEDLERTFTDYELGQNGFENAPGWKSNIKSLLKRK